LHLALPQADHIVGQKRDGFRGFALRALRGGHIRLTDLLPALPAAASPHDHVRTVAAAVLVLGMRLGQKATDTSAVVESLLELA
jgi:hypothetical protein